MDETGTTSTPADKPGVLARHGVVSTDNSGTVVAGLWAGVELVVVVFMFVVVFVVGWDVSLFLHSELAFEIGFGEEMIFGSSSKGSVGIGVDLGVGVGGGSDGHEKERSG